MRIFFALKNTFIEVVWIHLESAHENSTATHLEVARLSSWAAEFA